MRRRLLFSKFDHIEIYRGGNPVDELVINVGETVNDLVVIGVYKNGGTVTIPVGKSTWSSADPSTVSVNSTTGVIDALTFSTNGVNVTATYRKGGKDYTDSVKVKVKAVSYKYFLDANPDGEILCENNTATFGYTLYKNTYENDVLQSTQSVLEEIDVTYHGTSSFSVDGTMNNGSKDFIVGTNVHSESTKVYEMSFTFTSLPAESIETVNYGGKSHRGTQKITHLADSAKVDGDIITYSNFAVAISPRTVNYPNTGGSETFSATATQTKSTQRVWQSDETNMGTPIIETVTNSATFRWTADSGFVISDATSREITGTVGSNGTSQDNSWNVTVTAISTLDSAEATDTITVTQTSKSIDHYGTIRVKSGSVVNPVVSAAGGLTTCDAVFEQETVWSDGSTTYTELVNSSETWTQYEFATRGTTEGAAITVANGISCYVIGYEGISGTFTFDAVQEANADITDTKTCGEIWETPSITYNGATPFYISAEGGSVTADINLVKVEQYHVNWFTSGAYTRTKIDVTADSVISATTVTASSLGTIVKTSATLLADKVVISAIANCSKEGVKRIDCYQNPNTSHDGSAHAPVVDYGEWDVYFTVSDTMSLNPDYADEGDAGSTEGKSVYDRITYTPDNIPATGTAREVYARAERMKTTTYFYSSGEVCHIIREPDYCPAGDMSFVCTGGVVLSEPTHSASHRNMVEFPNPGNNESTSERTWTITASITNTDGTVTTAEVDITQLAGEVTWSNPAIGLTYSEADPLDDAESIPTLSNNSFTWAWNGVAGSGATISGTPTYSLVDGTYPEGTTIDRLTGVITWPMNDGGARTLTAQVTVTASAQGSTKSATVTAIASQRSGLEIDYVEYLDAMLYVESNGEAEEVVIGAAGGQRSIVKGGYYTTREHYTNGSESGTITYEIDAQYIDVTESGDTYNTFNCSAWNDSYATVSIDSLRTTTAVETTITYTPDWSDSDPIKANFPEYRINVLHLTQSENKVERIDYGQVALYNNGHYAMYFDALGNAVDSDEVNVNPSQSKREVYTSYEDGDTTYGISSDIPCDIVVGELTEEGSWQNEFTPQLNGYVIKVEATENTSVSSRTGYRVLLRVDGEGEMYNTFTLEVIQEGGEITYKYFIVAEDDYTILCTASQATFGYTAYKTKYINGTYADIDVTTDTVRATFSDDISGTMTSSNGTMVKQVEVNTETLDSKTYTATYSFVNESYNTTQKETNVPYGYVADYVQVITHDNDELVEEISYSDLTLKITEVDNADAADVTTVNYTSVGGSHMLYGRFSVKKTTSSVWFNTGTVVEGSEVVETLVNDDIESEWRWTKTADWINNSNTRTTSSYDALVKPNTNETSGRSATLSLTVTVEGMTVSDSVTLVQGADAVDDTLSKYFIVAEDDYNILCTDEVVVFAFRVIKNLYSRAGGYRRSSIYTGGYPTTADMENTKDGLTTPMLDVYAYTSGESRTMTVEVGSNAHNLSDIEYRIYNISLPAGFTRDTVNTTVTIGSDVYVVDYDQVITQSGDLYSEDFIYEYSGGSLIIDENGESRSHGTHMPTITFSKDGETKRIDAHASIDEEVYYKYVSDGSKGPLYEASTLSDDDFNFTWVLMLSSVPFDITEGFENANPTEVSIVANGESVSRSNTLTANAILKKSAIAGTVSNSTTLVQSAAVLPSYLTLEIDDADKKLSYNETCGYTVTLHMTDGSTTDVTDSAALWFYDSHTSDDEAEVVDPKIIQDGIGSLAWNNDGEITEAYDMIFVSCNKTTDSVLNTIRVNGSIVHNSEARAATSDETVYIRATYETLSTTRQAMTAAGRTGMSSTATTDAAKSANITWSSEIISAAESCIVDPRGASVNVQAISCGTYRITGTYEDAVNSPQSVNIEFTRATNVITINNPTYDTMEAVAEYEVYSNVTFNINYGVNGSTPTVHTYTIDAGNQSISDVHEGDYINFDTTVDPVITSPSNARDDRYNYVIQYGLADREITFTTILDVADCPDKDSFYCNLVYALSPLEDGFDWEMLSITESMDEHHTTVVTTVTCPAGNSVLNRGIGYSYQGVTGSLEIFFGEIENGDVIYITWTAEGPVFGQDEFKNLKATCDSSALNDGDTADLHAVEVWKLSTRDVTSDATFADGSDNTVIDNTNKTITCDWKAAVNHGNDTVVYEGEEISEPEITGYSGEVFTIHPNLTYLDCHYIGGGQETVYVSATENGRTTTSENRATVTINQQASYTKRYNAVSLTSTDEAVCTVSGLNITLESEEGECKVRVRGRCSDNTYHYICIITIYNQGASASYAYTLNIVENADDLNQPYGGTTTYQFIGEEYGFYIEGASSTFYIPFKLWAYSGVGYTNIQQCNTAAFNHTNKISSIIAAETGGTSYQGQIVNDENGDPTYFIFNVGDNTTEDVRNFVMTVTISDVKPGESATQTVNLMQDVYVEPLPEENATFIVPCDEDGNPITVTSFETDTDYYFTLVDYLGNTIPVLDTDEYDMHGEGIQLMLYESIGGNLYNFLSAYTGTWALNMSPDDTEAYRMPEPLVITVIEPEPGPGPEPSETSTDINVRCLYGNLTDNVPTQNAIYITTNVEANAEGGRLACYVTGGESFTLSEDITCGNSVGTGETVDVDLHITAESNSIQILRQAALAFDEDNLPESSCVSRVESGYSPLWGVREIVCVYKSSDDTAGRDTPVLDNVLLYRTNGTAIRYADYDKESATEDNALGQGTGVLSIEGLPNNCDCIITIWFSAPGGVYNGLGG